MLVVPEYSTGGSITDRVFYILYIEIPSETPQTTPDSASLSCINITIGSKTTVLDFCVYDPHNLLIQAWEPVWSPSAYLGVEDQDATELARNIKV